MAKSMNDESNVLDLTREIRQLTPVVPTSNDVGESEAGTALLISKDSDSRKWGPRWLLQSGLQATVAPDPANALVPDFHSVRQALKR